MRELDAHLDSLAGRDRKVLVDARYARYRSMGDFIELADGLLQQ